VSEDKYYFFWKKKSHHTLIQILSEIAVKHLREYYSLFKPELWLFPGQGKKELHMDIINVNEKNIEVFSKVLVESAEWLDSIGQPMWNANDLTVDKLIEKYDIQDMKMCYENGNLIGVYVLQWYDPLFWANLKKDEAGILHKLAVCRKYSKKGYGKKLIQSAELLCKNRNINWIRLNCGTFRSRLRNFYENAGFKMVDRVFIDNRDQIRYEKLI
jgi:GNAT superfamily N-acetyltransferase